MVVSPLGPRFLLPNVDFFSAFHAVIVGRNVRKVKVVLISATMVAALFQMCLTRGNCVRDGVKVGES